MIDFHVELYSEALSADIARLFKEEGFERTPEYLSWIFSPPAGRGLVALARDSDLNNGEVVGVLGLVPEQVLVAGEIRITWLVVDLLVNPAYRGRGIFTGLWKAAHAAAEKAGAAFVWGFPNANAAPGWFRRFGWVRLSAAPLMVRPLRTGAIFRKLVRASRGFDFSIGPRGEAEASATVIDRFGREADSFWAAASCNLNCSVVRDSRWLNWRTVDRPGRSYRRIGAHAQGQLAAVVVTARAEKRGFTILYVMEAISRSPEYRPLLLRVLKNELAAAAADGVEVALCLSPASAPNYGTYRRAGFLSLPERFHPTEMHFGVKPLVKLPVAAMKQESWYISYLDSDAL